MTRLILGGGSLGGLDQRSAEKIITVALDAGVTRIDVAPIYLNAEERIGQFLRKNQSENLKISTKVGIPAVIDPNAQKLNPDTINSSVDASLARLGIETIDTLFLHSVDSTCFTEENLTALQTLKNSGKVLKIGYAGDGPNLEVAMGLAEFEILMLSLNLIDQRNISYVNAIGLDKEIIVKRCLGSAVWQIRKYPIASHAKDVLAQHSFLDYYLRKILRARTSSGFTSYQYRFLRMFGNSRKDDFARLFLNFALSVPNVGSVVLGTTSPKNLLRAIEIEQEVERLTLSELAAIELSFSSLANSSWGSWT